ncbi:MAG: hypothetical protein QOJ51_3497 [Acidobacteriaceae bacterium]|nr:hypothetical protein [Acidobacteriaceae bacterium]
MNLGKVAALGIILLASRFTFADASYQETTQITGGSMVAPLKSMGFLSKSLRDMLAPNTTTTMVHGNQKAVVGRDFTEITDLDKETVTHIDNLHKTYTVVTFAQMRQAFQQMPKQMEQAQDKAKQDQAPQPQQPKSDVKTSFDVSVKNTGATKQINGLTAQEQLVTLQMHATDPNAAATQGPNAVTYVVTTDAWITPDPPEVKEIQDFDKRFGLKLMEGVDLSAFKAQMTRNMSQNPGMSHLFAGKPGSADAMTEMAKEMAKLQGTRVMEVTRMGGSGTGPASAQNSEPAPAATSPSNGSMAGMLGSALGGSALGGFHKKKPQPASDTTTTTTNSDGTQTTSATLMETTVQRSNFSQAPVSSSNFEVPGGFKKVDTPGYGAGAN